MNRQRLYIVNGWGPDSVGLVDALTTPLGRLGANVVDLRQDVRHGLFTIHMVVDLSQTELRLEDLTQLMERLAEDHGLQLSAEKFFGSTQTPSSEYLLFVLLGADRPGLVATASEVLGRYRANIERVECIAREGMFLMELLTDTDQCRIPLPHLMESLKSAMTELGMQTLFQSVDVFNKRKRVVLFDLGRSLLDPSILPELSVVSSISSNGTSPDVQSPDMVIRLSAWLRELEGLDVSVLSAVVEGATPSRGTVELVQALQTMGYKVALTAPVLEPLVEHLSRQLHLDHAFGLSVGRDDDTQTLLAELAESSLTRLSPDVLLPQLAAKENVSLKDISVVSDRGSRSPVGIRAELDLGQLLHLRTQRVLSQSQLTSLLGCFGLLEG